MNVGLVTAADLDRFRAAIVRWLGLHFDEAKSAFLAEVLERRTFATRRTPAAYLEELARDAPIHDEIRELARELTVGETYFFRHLEQFQAFAEIALPARLAARAAEQKLRILSAGCASGEEPYSLAILVRESAPGPAWQVAVRAVDVNASVLERAAHARYSTWSFRQTPAAVQRRWFIAEGREHVLDKSIRATVTFEEKNLAHDDAELWQPGAYDVVFCRNVLMYFTPEGAKALVARIARSLAPGGYLFLGHAETLRGLSNEFHLRHTHETFYYQRRDRPGRAEVAAAAVFVAPRSPSHPLAEESTTWIESIRRSTERVKELTRPHEAGTAGEAPSSRFVPRPDLHEALDLAHKERFAEALALLADVSPTVERDADTLLLRAVLLTHGGQVAEAEGVCARLLELDELNAGAHYVLALCREGMGDARGARAHDQTAIYLDPTFSMARLHLGLLARRAGERDVAQRELAQAILLLQREDASRLLLFGGGFGRDGLVALCRAELARLGGQS